MENIYACKKSNYFEYLFSYYISQVHYSFLCVLMQKLNQTPCLPLFSFNLLLTKKPGWFCQNAFSAQKSEQFYFSPRIKTYFLIMTFKLNMIWPPTDSLIWIFHFSFTHFTPVTLVSLLFRLNTGHTSNLLFLMSTELFTQRHRDHCLTSFKSLHHFSNENQPVHPKTHTHT